MKLWRCPDCGNQKRAPGKPRRNDVRRFCLPCSQRTGYMVERVCPTLEKKRAKVKAKVSAKGKAVRAKATAVRKIKKASVNDQYFYGGVDVRPIYKRMQTILKRNTQEIGEPGWVVNDPSEIAIKSYRDQSSSWALENCVWRMSGDLLYSWVNTGAQSWRHSDEFARICRGFRSIWRHDVVKIRNGWPEAYGGS